MKAHVRRSEYEARTFKDRRVLQPEVRGGNKIHLNPAAATCAGGGAVVLAPVRSVHYQILYMARRSQTTSEVRAPPRRNITMGVGAAHNVGHEVSLTN